MSRDVITVGSTMRIPLLYRGEYSQWRERFMNYLEEQTNGEAMINSIQNGDQPLPIIAPVSLAGTAQNASPTLKDPKFWTAEEKKTRKIDRLAISLLIQGLPNDIYSLIDSNKTAKDLWDALERQMREQLLDTYPHYLQVINDLKKCDYKKDNYELNYKFLNNLQPEWKQYGTLMRQTKNLMDINIDALYNILKQNQGDVNDTLGYKKKAVVVTSDPLALVAEKTKRTSSTSQSANKKQEFVKSDDKKEDNKANDKKRDMSKVKCYNCKKEGHFAKDCKKAKVKYYNYYKTKILLAKKDSDEQVLLAEDQAWMESSSDSDQEINANMVFMAQIKQVLSESDESSSFAEETIAEVAYYTSESESEFKFETLEYYDNSINYGLIVNNDDDYFQEIINPDFEKIDSPFQQTSSLKPYVPTVILEKIIIDLEDEVVSLLERKANLKTIESLKSKGFESSENAISESENQSENDCHVVEKECDQVGNSKKKWSSNTSNVDFSSVSYSKLNKDVKLYSLKDLLSCNNSHLGETSSAYVCNDAMNVSCNSRMCDLFDENNLIIIDDESVRISPVSKMHFRKKPHDSLNVRSKRNSNKSLPRIVHRWLPKMQLLAEPVAKWFPKIVQICLWIIDSGCSKHMTVNRALLTNFVEKFFGTVRFGNNDFTVIAGYGDVVIGSMTIKKVYYVEGLGHNLFSVGQFCAKGLKVAFRKSTCFVRNEDGVDLLTGGRSSNLYTIALNEVASNSSTCLLEKASFSQSWLWHQRLSHLNFATINNLVKNNLVQGLPKM
nr:integrase, catalytic region, zinc finger, CCHC-type, peptidase aspartic, catalytic [Tanacetum cinerariifolium]